MREEVAFRRKLSKDLRKPNTSLTFDVCDHAKVCWHIWHWQTLLVAGRKIWRAAFEMGTFPQALEIPAWVRSSFIALCFSCKLMAMGKLCLACDKAVPSWIILAEQPDLQQAVTKGGPLSSCHPLQHTVHGWVVKWSPEVCSWKLLSCLNNPQHLGNLQVNLWCSHQYWCGVI